MEAGQTSTFQQAIAAVEALSPTDQAELIKILQKRLQVFSLVHLSIQDGKVWIQRNQTDQVIAERLTEMGVDRQDIVLGLRPHYARAYTGYGVA